MSYWQIVAVVSATLAVCVGGGFAIAHALRYLDRTGTRWPFVLAISLVLVAMVVGLPALSFFEPTH